MVHFTYIIILIIFVNHNYINGHKNQNHLNEIYADETQLILMGITIIYPLFYELFQLYQDGPTNYFLDISNWNNVSFIGVSIATFVIHQIYPVTSIVPKVGMTLMIILSVSRTLEYMRIQKQFSPIVTMMFSVLFEMADFLTFLGIVTLFLSLIPAILQFGNIHENGNHDGKTKAPYEFLNMNIANILVVLRFSMSDFDNI